MTMNLKVLSPRPDEAAMKSSSPFLAICLAATPQRSQEAITIFEGLTGICRPSINFTGQTAGRFVAPESCSDEVAVVLLINAAAGTAPFVRNLPILVLQFEPEVSTGTELQIAKCSAIQNGIRQCAVYVLRMLRILKDCPSS